MNECKKCGYIDTPAVSFGYSNDVCSRCVLVHIKELEAEVDHLNTVIEILEDGKTKPINTSNNDVRKLENGMHFVAPHIKEVQAYLKRRNDETDS